MKEMIPLSLRQRKAFVWWARREYEDYAAIICDGAIRSGKTLAMGMGFFFWAMACFSDRQFALCGRSVGALRRNLLETVLPQLRRLGFACEEKRSEKLLIVRRRGRENRFYLFGGANEASAALIQGMTLAGVLFDEAALMPRSFVEQASARCSVEGSRLWFSCNPEGPNHWFYREWACRAEEKRALYLHFTMEDNPSLSARVRARYESMYSGIFYRRFVLGEWTAAEGRIYDFYAPGEYAQEAPAEPWERLRVSVDYGTVNPTSMGLWALKDGVWYRVDEYYYDSRTEGRQKTDEEYVDALEELTRGRRIERVIVDPSAASFIETLRRRGFRVMRANNAVADGLRVTADLLKKRRLVICRSCKDCLREMESYEWVNDGSGHDVPRKENDHAMDEMRYFAMSVAAVQVRERGGHPFAALRGYMPLGGADAALYRSVREAVPIVDAAIGKLVRLSGGFRVLCEDERAQEELGEFLRTVNVGHAQVGFNAFLDKYLDSLLTNGRAVGEIVPDAEGREIAAVLCHRVEQLALREGETALDVRFCGYDAAGRLRELPRQELVLFTPLLPESENPYGVSLLRSMPFMAELLSRIYYAVGQNWERCGNVRFAVVYKPQGEEPDGALARERAELLAQEWSGAMQETRGGSVRDFVSVGDVSIRAIGADNVMPDCEVPVRQILEQLVAKTGLPPFLLGLSWSSTERMSSQQADMLTSEITALRRTLTPMVERVCRLWLRLHGYGCRFAVEWDDINLQDLVEEAKAELYREQARRLRLENDEREEQT